MNLPNHPDQKQAGLEQGDSKIWPGYFKVKRPGPVALIFAAALVLLAAIYFIYPRPNIVVEDFEVPSDVGPGEEVIVAARAENRGRVEGTSSVTLFVEERGVETIDLVLGPGEQRKVEFNFRADYPPGELKVYLVPEADQSARDELSAVIRILKPAEFVVKDFVLTAEEINIGDTIEAAVLLANVGEMEGRHPVTLFLNGRRVKSREVSLTGETETELIIPFSIEDPGSHTVTVEGLKRTITAFQIERLDNGYVLANEISGGNGRLVVTNHTELDNLFILSAPEDPLTPLLAVYIRAEESAAVSGIRDGSYVSYFSLGTNWDSHSKRFTQDVQYGRFAEPDLFETTRQADGGYYYTLLEIDFDLPDPEEPAPLESVRPADFPALGQ